MDRTEESIKAQVRIILDHNEVTTGIAGLDDVDTLSIDDIITAQILPAARQVEMISPTELADWSYLDAGYLMDDGSFIIPLESRMLRFGSVKLSDWMLPVNSLVTVDSKEYKRQFTDFSGLKASIQRPLAAYLESYAGVWSDGGDSTVSIQGPVIQCFGTDDDSTLQWATIVKEPEWSDDEPGVLEIGDVLIQPLHYVCAALVAETLKDTAKSNEMMAIAVSLLNNSDDKTNNNQQ